MGYYDPNFGKLQGKWGGILVIRDHFAGSGKMVKMINATILGRHFGERFFEFNFPLADLLFVVLLFGKEFFGDIEGSQNSDILRRDVGIFGANLVEDLIDVIRNAFDVDFVLISFELKLLVHDADFISAFHEKSLAVSITKVKRCTKSEV